MSTCEACGGDGLIEVGAYRGDEDDTTTRMCVLCEGKASESCQFQWSNGGLTTEQLREIAGDPLIHLSSESGRRTVDLVIEPRAKTPQEVSAEYTDRLKAENGRRQREAKRDIRYSWTTYGELDN